ncbi:MAG: efflux RND transporter periplasmic adaptor subunit [Planctomycetes bacterium]|nr:efflux RND transporter periplasmic adaptor subunit [Planctomycetota bacterium]
MKRAWIVAVVVLVGATAVAVTQYAESAHDEPGASLVLYGNVEIRDARLAFREQELVASVEVEEGDRVAPGQVLARLRGERLAAERAQASARRDAQAEVVRRLRNGSRPEEVGQARAELAAAEVRRDTAHSDLERVERTASGGASSAQDLDRSRGALRVAEADVEVRRQALALAEAGPREELVAEAEATLAALDAQLALLDARVADLALVAPSAGTIQSRLLEPGEMAGPNQPAFTLALTDPKWIRVHVAEGELGRVALGQSARVTSDTWGDESFPGCVGFVSPVAEFTPKAVETADLRTRLVYEVRVWVDDPGDRLRLGMPVTVELATDAQGAAAPGDVQR